MTWTPQSFETLAGQGRQALDEGDASRAVALLAEALGLWRGRALDGVPPSDLVLAEASRLEESRLDVLELRITADLRCGRAGQLVSELRRLISEHPIREGLWVLLLEALDLAGRRAEAIAAFSEARSAISDELGVDPGPELRRIYQRLLAADRSGTEAADGAGEAEAPGARAGAEAAGRAERDPEAGLADADAAAGTGGASEPGGPAQLPADVADFTGRQEHLLRLRQMLTPASSAANPAAVNIAGGGRHAGPGQDRAGRARGACAAPEVPRRPVVREPAGGQPAAGQAR